MIDDKEKLVEELNDIANEFDLLLQDESILSLPKQYNKCCGRLNDVIGILEQKVESFNMKKEDEDA
jgi:hypothetical protein